MHPPAAKMTPKQERGVRRALGFAETLEHPGLVRCMGNWECDDYIYIGEGAEGVTRGVRDGKGRRHHLAAHSMWRGSGGRAWPQQQGSIPPARASPACCPARPVEEYINKGDVLNEAISHPDKYSERFVALNVARPLLSVLAYMHANNIIHRCAGAAARRSAAPQEVATLALWSGAS